jgi:hypothetical protein
MAFDSPDLNLGALLGTIRKGALQLPDFQREWKWDDDRIKSLLASVGRGHPIGVLMTLEVGGDGSSFAPKPLAGVSSSVGAPEQLLLDGQQRLTSLFQSLASSAPVDTVDSRGKRLRRWYYVDIGLVLQDGSDLEDAILSIPEDRLVRDQFGRNVERDYSSIESECALEAFPLSVIFDYSRFTDWQMHYLTADPDSTPVRLGRWKQFNDLVLKNFIGYTVPAIVLKKDTSKEAVCTVFEKVNTGGVPLNVFELMTATFAADGFRLKDDWATRRSQLVAGRPVLDALESTDFLQIVSLLATRARKERHEQGGAKGHAPGVGCKRKDILRLTLEEYKRWSNPATEGLEWAATFLNREFIFASKDVPYKTQLVPLAALRAILGRDIDQYGTHGSVRRWYWSGVFGELYGGSTETRFARDIEQVPAWVRGSEEPGAVTESAFRQQRLLSLHTRNSAAYKGIYALLMRHGSLDWMKNQPMSLATFFNYQVDIHHVFPKAWCAKNGIDHARQESIVNKTAIGRVTNIKIGGRSPALYVKTIETDAGLSSDQLDVILRSHEIDPLSLRQASFDTFFLKRTDALLAIIEEATGKSAIRDVSEDEAADAFEEDLVTEIEDPTFAEVEGEISGGLDEHQIAD